MAQAGPDLVFPDESHPDERAEGGEDGAPGNKHRGTDGRQPPKDRGGGDQDDEQMKLKKRADGRIMDLPAFVSSREAYGTIAKSSRLEGRRSCAAKRQHPLEWETPASFGRIRAENLK